MRSEHWSNHHQQSTAPFSSYFIQVKAGPVLEASRAGSSTRSAVRGAELVAHCLVTDILFLLFSLNRKIGLWRHDSFYQWIYLVEDSEPDPALLGEPSAALGSTLGQPRWSAFQVRSVYGTEHVPWCLRLKVCIFCWVKTKILLEGPGLSTWHEYGIPSCKCFQADLRCHGQLLARGWVWFGLFYFCLVVFFFAWVWVFGVWFFGVLLSFLFLKRKKKKVEWLKQLLSSWEENW